MIDLRGLSSVGPNGHAPANGSAGNGFAAQGQSDAAHGQGEAGDVAITVSSHWPHSPGGGKGNGLTQPGSSERLLVGRGAFSSSSEPEPAISLALALERRAQPQQSGVLSRACSTLKSLSVLVVGLLIATACFMHGVIRAAKPTHPAGHTPATLPALSPAPAPPGTPDPSRPAVGWKLKPGSCSLKDFVELMSCRHGYNADCCASYRPFLEHQCVCDYAAWPQQWIPADASPGGWMANLMKCEYPLSYISNFSHCVDQVTTPSSSTHGRVKPPRSQPQCPRAQSPPHPCPYGRSAALARS
ncbi:hypothetical protein T492DRAFT_900172 [Pavlovales sp. CCMP2436]|nr:hypothetical protein T492DRAFT_900172 [Pavlovales sp. CCMP2436]